MTASLLEAVVDDSLKTMVHLVNKTNGEHAIRPTSDYSDKSNLAQIRCNDENALFQNDLPWRSDESFDLDKKFMVNFAVISNVYKIINMEMSASRG